MKSFQHNNILETLLKDLSPKLVPASLSLQTANWLRGACYWQQIHGTRNLSV